LDIRDYLLVAFGGSGPLQAGKLVDLLGLEGALVPPNPGNVSAFGLLTVDLKNDYVVTAVQRDDSLDLGRLRSTYARLEEQARASHAKVVVRSADLRYFGQAWEVRVDVPAGQLDRAAADVAVERFHLAHEKTYGYSYQGSSAQAVEWVNLRVTGIQPIRLPPLATRERSLAGGVERARTGSRRVVFDRDSVETLLYARELLQPGDCLAGAAIIEEYGSTTVVLPGQVARIDDYGNLLLTPA
jgi:N-methylhydantoinase A